VDDPADTHPPASGGSGTPSGAADWTGRALRFALVAAISTAAAFLLAPSSGHRLPGIDALGTPAPAMIKADRDYDIVDADATARRRSEAASAERPVYLHDAGAAEEAVARIHAAFASMREQEVAPGRHAAQRDAFIARLQVVVRDDDFAALAQARFSESAEQALAFLAQKGLSDTVVEDDLLLLGDRDRGFVVRTLRGGALQGERVVTDLALVRDLATAREEVARGREAGGRPGEARREDHRGRRADREAAPRGLRRHARAAAPR
jgi:hypothetical protein